MNVPRRGLLVGCEDVCFEGIDFVWEDAAGSAVSDERLDAMFTVRAQTVTFRRCSFTVAAGGAPVAIRFVGSADLLPGLGGEVALFDCVVDGLAAVVDDRAGGSLSVQVNNSLCVAAGPILRLPRWPARGESVSLVLDHVTTRGDTAVVECRQERLPAPSGSITVTANESVLAANVRGALVILSGTERPEPFLESLAWTGEGSIVTPHTAMAVWRVAGRRSQTLAEEELEVAGLVRSELEFAGPANGPPEASRVTRWQVPLRSADPPGADPDSLSRPER